MELTLYKKEHKILSCVALGRLRPLPPLLHVDRRLCLPVLCYFSYSFREHHWIASLSGLMLEVGDSQELKGSQLNLERPLSQPGLESDACLRRWLWNRGERE